MDRLLIRESGSEPLRTLNDDRLEFLLSRYLHTPRRMTLQFPLARRTTGSSASMIYEGEESSLIVDLSACLGDHYYRGL